MTLSDFLSRLTGVTEQTDGWLAICPSHSDSDPSLRVAVGKDGDRVMVKCRTGCPTEDVLEALSLTFADLADMTVDAAAARVERATSTNAPAPGPAIAALRADLDRYASALSPVALEYASRRFGITEDDARRLDLGEHEGRLVVPFFNADGVALGYQARAIDPNVDLRWKGPRRPEGGGSWAKHGILTGAGTWSEVLVCEGPGDGLTAAALGYDVVFIAGAGNARNDAILDETAAFADGRKVIVAGDGDRAGAEFSTAVSRGLIDRGCSVAVLTVPEDDDLSSWRERDPSGRGIVRGVQDAPLMSTFTSAARVRDEGDYPLTDLGNARFLRDYAKGLGSALRYSPEAGFFVLADGVWRGDDLDSARAFAQEAAEVTAGIAADMLDNAVSKDEFSRANAWKRWATYSQSSKGIDAAVREVKALRDVATALDAFDKRPDLLACRNGVVNLRTGVLLPHDPAYLLTKRIDVEYKPDAKAPRWEAFLREVFPNHPDLPAYMQRLTGYGITGHTDEQCFAIHWGRGANGKSVYTDTLTEVFREATVTTPFDTFEAKPSGGIPNDIAALKGARLVMASEGDAGKPMAEAMLKRVTGRDLVTARFMRKEFFEFRPTFLLMLASNAKPQFRGQDEGLWRRVKLIPWERFFTPEERDPHLGATLLREAEGILAWAVAGAVEWYTNGLQDPAVVVNSTKDYRETSNMLDGFLPGEWEVDSTARGVNSSDLYESYREWADREGLQAREVWTKRTLNAALEERGLSKRKTNGHIVFDGVRRASAVTPRAADEPPALSPVTATNTAPKGADLDSI